MKKLLNTTDMLAIYNVSRTGLWRRVKDELIPPPIKIHNRNYWSSDVVSEHVDVLLTGGRGVA